MGLIAGLMDWIAGKDSADTVAGAAVLALLAGLIALLAQIAGWVWRLAEGRLVHRSRRRSALLLLFIDTKIRARNTVRQFPRSAHAAVVALMHAEGRDYRGYAVLPEGEADAVAALWPHLHELPPRLAFLVASYRDYTALFDRYYLSTASDAFAALSLARKERVLDQLYDTARDVVDHSTRIISELRKFPFLRRIEPDIDDLVASVEADRMGKGADDLAAGPVAAGPGTG